VHFEHAHLRLLLLLHLLPLLCDLSLLRFLRQLHVLKHLILVQLVVQDVLVGVLKLGLVHALLLDLLRGYDTPRFFLLPLDLFKPLLFFLLLHGEVGHVLGVDVRLLVVGCAQLGQVPLLVRVPRIVLEFRESAQVSPGLARLDALLPWSSAPSTAVKLLY